MCVINGCGGHQLTTFNKQARVLVGADRDKFDKLTRLFHGIIAGLSRAQSVNSVIGKIGLYKNIDNK